MNEYPIFPKHFIFGATTAAYQIEGACREDGKGLSIWDEFSHRPGKIRNNDTGDIACDHYHRYKDDIAIMKRIGLDAYRFSIAWPRIFPDGVGTINHKGVDFYNALVDELLSAGITPFVTLYHWDLPLALFNRGGWASRESANWFADYAAVMARHFKGRVKHWITINEPNVHSIMGHLIGAQAPGLKNIPKYFKVVHNMLRGHGMAIQALKAESSNNKVGITLDLHPFYPEYNTEKDRRAANYADIFQHRIFLDPLFKGTYPEHAVKKAWPFWPTVTASDMETISTPMDFLGINNYSRSTVYHAWWVPIFKYYSSEVDIPEHEYEKNGSAYTSMGWEVYPNSLYEVLIRIKNDYGNLPTYITENGAAFADTVDGAAIHDEKRKEYLEQYINALKRALDDGANCRGYFVWSLIDNFEWHLGFSKRFGIVHVDYHNQRRIIKDSGKWYGRLIAAQKKQKDGNVDR